MTHEPIRARSPHAPGRGRTLVRPLDNLRPTVSRRLSSSMLEGGLHLLLRRHLGPAPRSLPARGCPAQPRSADRHLASGEPQRRQRATCTRREEYARGEPRDPTSTTRNTPGDAETLPATRWR
eukprot:scaffold779_cov355-Prasinococcus_capsulatus_cf.AAC.3